MRDILPSRCYDSRHDVDSLCSLSSRNSGYRAPATSFCTARHSNPRLSCLRFTVLMGVTPLRSCWRSCWCRVYALAGMSHPCCGLFSRSSILQTIASLRWPRTTSGREEASYLRWFRRLLRRLLSSWEHWKLRRLLWIFWRSCRQSGFQWRSWEAPCTWPSAASLHRTSC